MHRCQVSSVDMHGLHPTQPNAGLPSGGAKDGKSYLIKRTMQMDGNGNYK